MLMLSGWTCNRHSLRGNPKNFLRRRFEERPWTTKPSNLKSFKWQIHIAGHGSSFSMQPKRGLASRLHVPTPCWMPNSLSRKRLRADNAASSNSKALHDRLLQQRRVVSGRPLCCASRNSDIELGPKSAIGDIRKGRQLGRALPPCNSASAWRRR